MAFQQLLEKDCLSCGAQIKISKIENPPANSKKRWNKYNLDMTEHLCGGNRRGNIVVVEKQQQQQQPPLQPSQQPDLAEELSRLREENKELRALVGLTRQDVRSLVAQVQLLRQELNSEKK